MHRPLPATMSVAPPRHTAVSGLVVLVLVAGLGTMRPGVAAAGPPDERDQARFMWAMAGQESGWNYYSRNSVSGAFGKYQIMPFNWPVWAAEYLGDVHADQTPYNQEKVASGKLHDLYRWLGSWKRVAYWWLTGSSEKREKKWSAYAKGYVTNIMRLRKRAPRQGSAMPARTSSRASKGDWRRSGQVQALRTSVAGKRWDRKGRLRDGQVLKVHNSKRARNGARWIEVIAADGRLGWLRQSKTVPARKPNDPKRWADVRKPGGAAARHDRSQVRPRPR